MRKLLLHVLCAWCAVSAGPASSSKPKLLNKQVRIGKGDFMYGQGGGSQEQGGVKPRRAKVKPFYIDPYAVSNRQFQRFVRDTKYKTEAEAFGWSFVLDYLCSPDILAHADGDEGMGRVKEAKQWVAVEEAYWRRPEGKGSTIKGRENHPVVHVSYADGVAYCQWANGRRLPTELEWEYAARGGMVGEPFPWGGGEALLGEKEGPPMEERRELGKDFDGTFLLNGWQGNFHSENTKEDGFAGTCPVDEYIPNEYGLYNMVGNVWEWCELTGPKSQEQQRQQPGAQQALRGGSYVDSVDGSFNHAIRVTTRMLNSPDSGSHNTGIRCASGDRENAVPLTSSEALKDMDQEELSRIAAEGGIEALQEYLAELGPGVEVMTADKLQEKRDGLKDKLENMKAGKGEL